MSVSAIVLAAGESRRMGEANKLLLPVHGKPMIRHVVEGVTASTAQECIVVVGHEAEKVKAVLDGLPISFELNPNYPEGMSTSIHAGVAVASREAAGYMICLSDMPFIRAEEYDELIDQFELAFVQNSKAIVVPTYQGQRGNPVVISSSYKSAILAHQGVVGCKSIVKKNPDHVTWHPMVSDHITRDVDTPAAFNAISSDT